MKQIHFNIPDEVYEQFHKLFPSHGDKSAFLRQVVIVSVKNASKKDFFANVAMGKGEKDK